MSHIRSLLVILALIMVIVACTQEDTSLEATIVAQNTRIAQLSLPGAATPSPDSASTSLPIISTWQSQNDQSATNGELPTETPMPATNDQLSAETSMPPTVEPSISVPALLWSSAAESYAVSEDKMFIELPDNRVEARDLATGTLIWSSDSGGKILDVDFDTVYILAASQRIDALDSNSGQFKWRFLFEGDSIRLNAAVNNEFVYLYLIKNPNYSLVAIDKRSGDIWKTFEQGGAIFENIIMIRVWPSDYIDFGVSIDTGEVTWDLHEQVRKSILCQPFLVYESNSGPLEAIDIATGELKWSGNSFPSIDRISCSKESNTVYVEYGYLHFFGGLEENYLAGVDKMNGTTLWQGPVINRSYSMFHHSDVFDWLGERAGKVAFSHEGFGVTQLYDAQSYELMWENQQIVLKRLYAIENGVLLGRVSEGTMVGLDVNTGDMIWQYEAGKPDIVKFMFGQLIHISDGTPVATFLHPGTGEVNGQIELPYGRFGQELIRANEFLVYDSGNSIAVLRP